MRYDFKYAVMVDGVAVDVLICRESGQNDGGPISDKDPGVWLYPLLYTMY